MLFLNATITYFFLRLLFYYPNMLVCRYVHAPCVCSARSGQKRENYPVEQELQMALNCLMVLGAELRSSARAAKPPHC